MSGRHGIEQFSKPGQDAPEDHQLTAAWLALSAEPATSSSLADSRFCGDASDGPTSGLRGFRKGGADIHAAILRETDREVNRKTGRFYGYSFDMETFADRFNRLTSGHDDAEIAMISGLKYNTIRDIRSGNIKSIKLDAALRLCRKLGFSPWELQGEPPPMPGAPVNAATPQNDAVPPPAVIDLTQRIAYLEAGLARVNERLKTLVSPQPAAEKTPRRPARQKQ